MFNTVTLRQKYTSKEFKKIESELRIKLFQLQQECAKHKLAVIITIAGVENSGRGAVANLLSTWFDAKKLTNQVFWRKDEEAKLRPKHWRYWAKLPMQGEVGLFLGGWYGEPMRRAACGDMSEKELMVIMHDKVKLERTLADNNYVLVKFWLHLDEKEHKKRQKIRKAEKGVCHFSHFEKENGKNYTAVLDTVAKVIPMTDTDFARWYIVDAYDKEFRDASVVKTLIRTMEEAIAAQILNKAKVDAQEDTQVIDSTDTGIAILDRVDLSKTLTKERYSERVKELQNEVYQLTYEAFQKGISSTLAFEGWDAGGKGGAIRRLTGGIDSRITRVIPISSPTDEELARHYLWRFWRHVPMAGYVTVYDRTWYGRVLVERVEGFARPEEWKRAYAEINSFEKQLVDDKNILLKFWMHISPEEQLRRFKEREQVSWKQYKITEEDWRNREKSTAYKIAADEMFQRTDTAYAPWHIIPAESKYYARIEVLTIYRDALLQALHKKNGHGEQCSAKIARLKSVKEITKGHK